MGRIWTVSGMARAVVCALLPLASACSNANLGWNYFPGYGHLHGYFPPLRVSGPNFVSAASTCSQAFSVGFADSSGEYVSSTANVKLQLSGSGSTTFYSDSTCTTAITETQLASGALSQDFYLKNPKAGVQSIQASHPDLPAVSRKYQVDPAPPASIKIEGPSTFSKDTCVPYVVSFVDAGGNAVPFDATDTLTLTFAGSGGGETVHDENDPFCSGAAATTYNLFAGSYTQTIYLTSPNLSDNMTLVATTTSLTSPILALTTGAAASSPVALKMTGVSTQLQIGDCDQVTAFPVDASGYPLTAAAATTIMFSSTSGNVAFYTDFNCTTSGSTDTANPSNAAKIFIRDSAREKAKIIASSAGLTDDFVNIDFANRALQISAGDSHTCAYLKAGKVECWGSNLYGQLGVAATAGNSAVPLSLASLVTLPGQATLIAAGAYHTCAIVQAGANNEVWCWGRNNRGQLGANSVVGTDSAAPILAWQPGSGISDVTAGADHTCAVESNTNTVWCWGDNVDGQLGDAGTFGAFSENPLQVPALTTGWVTASGNTTCSLDFAFSLNCWGSNLWGQLQLDPTSTPNSAIPILLNASSQSAGLGAAQGCYVDSTTYDLKCWGRNLHGELGFATGKGSSSPIFTPTALGIQRPGPSGPAISGGDGFTCAVIYGGVLCFGQNDQGQLGDGSTISSEEASFVPVSVNSTYVPGFGAGKAHACAAQHDGSVACWGSNANAQLGSSLSTMTYSSTPIVLNL